MKLDLSEQEVYELIKLLNGARIIKFSKAHEDFTDKITNKLTELLNNN